MLNKVKEEIKTVQTRVLDAQEQFVDQADDMGSQARHRVHLARGEGAVRLWNFENQALDWVDGLLDQVLNQCLQFGPGQFDIEVLRARLIGGDERQVYLRLRSTRKLNLGLLGGLLETLHSQVVVA